MEVVKNITFSLKDNQNEADDNIYIAKVIYSQSKVHILGEFKTFILAYNLIKNYLIDYQLPIGEYFEIWIKEKNKPKKLVYSLQNDGDRTVIIEEKTCGALKTLILTNQKVYIPGSSNEGLCYKDTEAFINKTDKICYIPELEFSNAKELTIVKNGYKFEDFLRLARNSEKYASDLFDRAEWASIENYISEDSNNRKYNRRIAEENNDKLILCANDLPDGWYWTRYKEDGSGGLVGPNKQAYCSFDSLTREYKYEGNGNRWDFELDFDLEKIMDIAEKWVLKNIIKPKEE